MLINTFLFLVTVLAYLAKGITGFGNTLIMASLFSFVVAPALTTPVDLLISLPTNIVLVWREHQNINFRMVFPLYILVLAGDIPGVLLLKAGNDYLLKAFLGLAIIGIATQMYFAKNKKLSTKQSNPLVLTGVGLLSGILAGLYGIAAPLVAYINQTAQNRNQFRANLCSVFLVDNLFRLGCYLALGILNQKALFMTLFLAPAVTLGMFSGIKIDSRLKESTVNTAVITLLIFSGATLFLKSIWFWL